MTLEQRRSQLRVELMDLVCIVIKLHLSDPANADQNPFLAEIERQMAEKAAELETLNAKLSAPGYQFRREIHSFRWLLWLIGGMTLLGTLLLLPFDSSGLCALTGLAAVLSLSLAAWGSTLPKC